MKSARHFLVACDFATFYEIQDRDGQFGRMSLLKGEGR